MKNHAETKFYYKNNWEQHRQKAQSKGYIESYMLLETEPSEQAPFHFMLITTYPNQASYDQREQNFRPLIDAAGGRKLLNDKQPSEFRKILFAVNAKGE